ncbi:hypothetical protein L486_02864 [Kwoniella mangroviensis CBS 10435]|uniref:Uncharacterized protein n=1 Tax=Kwoniella mangroviensis CBS 10435 TaxID=1331196 RepID=A0A1B9IXM6_9TREE|nr:hypothetical protein L486_02864 [Kwoniella mangroviensis CBS 10435]
MFFTLDKSITSLIYDLKLDEKSRPRPKAGTMWPTDVDSVVRRYQPTLDSITESEKPSACASTTYDTMAEQQHGEAVDEEEAWRGFLDGVGIAHSVGTL